MKIIDVNVERQWEDISLPKFFEEALVNLSCRYREPWVGLEWECGMTGDGAEGIYPEAKHVCWRNPF